STIEAIEEAILIYPNPTNDQLFIEMEQAGNANIQVLDMLGRQVNQYNFDRSTFQLNMTTLPSGIYYISIEKDGKYWIEKVIKE
ncbi:MAG: T9SS type A sorting domain-containing protein, partial [Bacteroidota bacterium]